jgi:uncharacterized protein (DUF697 family)
MAEISDAQVTPAIIPTEDGATKIVNRYILWSMGAGLVPIPIIDVAAIIGVQMKMLSQLSKYYSVEFSEEKGKSLVSSLIGGIAAESIAHGSIGSFLKSIPGAGTLFGMIAMPLSAGATTYAIGKVFTQHFASGGNLLNFNPDEARDLFNSSLKEGKQVARDMKAKIV